jgi:hypothetical protein
VRDMKAGLNPSVEMRSTPAGEEGEEGMRGEEGGRDGGRRGGGRERA